jgi:hypothetical protein
LRGKTKSCGSVGCKMGGKHTKSGSGRPLKAIGQRVSDDPLFRTWYGMMSRCYNPKATGYRYWGGRGIKVCERWHDMNLFSLDVGIKPAGTTLDRIDNNGNYEPGNWRWADWKTQIRNRRKIQK